MDFTNLPRKNKTYTGANGSKIAVELNGSLYMLKFPSLPKRNKDMSYTNGCLSEYIGSHIFEIVGIPVQETLLGTFSVNGKEKIVVACKDFTTPDLVLQDFASLKNTIIDSEHNGYGTELDDILSAIETQTAVPVQEVKQRFWDMFIVDALIGNWDRHNGNWGFLFNRRTDELTLAPVYDCGSCLFPQADETIMRDTLSDQAERHQRVFNIPLSGIKVDGKKINYFDFISSLSNKECNAALKRIIPRIDMKRIDALIDETPFINDLQRSFYKTMLHERNERILNYSRIRLRKREQSLER